MKNETQSMEIKPTKRLDRSTSNQLALSQSNFEILFKRLVKFIDASPNTVRTYQTSLKQWFIYMQDNGITQPKLDDVRNYREKLRSDGKKPTTIQNYIIAVKQFFKWTDAEGIYPNIAQHIKGAKIGRNFKKDYLTGGQAKHVLDCIDRSTLIGKRDYAMLVLMLTMGLRTIEVSRANIEDMEQSGNTTVLLVQGKGHVEKDARIKMPDHVEQAIREYLAERKSIKLDDPLFTSTSNNNRGKRMTTRSISGIVKKRFINAGYNSPRWTAHSTRHTAATLSLLGGATLQQTQALLRHQNIQTTEIYAHNLDAEQNPASNDVEKAIFGE